MYEFSSAHLKLDGIWEFVFSQYFWGQVVIDDGDDFDGCDTFVNSNIIGFQFGRKYATAHARWNIVGRLGQGPTRTHAMVFMLF